MSRNRIHHNGFPDNPQGIPAELLLAPIWGLWRYEERDGKPTKVPYSPSGHRARTNDPTGWVDYATALAALKRGGYDGLGILLGPIPGDPQGRNLAGVDLDWKEWEGDGAQIIPDAAQAVIGRFSTYTERSPSRKGCHLLFFGKLPEGARNRHTLAPGVELEVYDKGRYFTFTGDPIRPLPVQDQQAQLEGLLEKLGLLAKPEPQKPPFSPFPVPQEFATGVSEATLQAYLQALFSGKDAHLARELWEGRWEGRFPSQSEADYALAKLLLIATWGDLQAADALFRRSKLYRPKWDEKHYADGKTYGQATLQKALEALKRGDWPRPSLNGALQSRATGIEEEGGRKSAATKALELILEEAELWCDPQGEPWATFERNGHRENWPLDSAEFEEWLSARYYRTHGKALDPQAIKTALLVAKEEARNGPRHEVFHRVAHVDGEVYLDLGRPDWAVVEVDATGWRVLQGPPPGVHFKRSPTMWPLPDPEPGSVDDIRELLSLWPFSREQEDLIITWLLGLLTRGPYPALAITGPQGAGKTMLARTLRYVVDPVDPRDVGDLPRNTEELYLKATHTHILGFDNVSSLSGELSDALCRVATGGALTVRKLYTNRRMVILRAQNPVILNGIPDFITRPDLMDRTIVLQLEGLPQKRFSEAELWAQIEELRPKVLGALLDLASLAIRNLDRTPTPEVRMADWARWALAAEEGFTEKGAFLRAFEGMRQESEAVARESEPIYPAVLKLLENGAFRGTAQDLYDRLEALRDGEERPSRWPKSPQALINALKRFAPVLQGEGIIFRKGELLHGRRIWHLERRPKGPDSGPSAPPPGPPSRPSPSRGPESPQPVVAAASPPPASRPQERLEASPASTPPPAQAQTAQAGPASRPQEGGELEPHPQTSRPSEPQKRRLTKRPPEWRGEVPGPMALEALLQRVQKEGRPQEMRLKGGAIRVYPTREAWLEELERFKGVAATFYADELRRALVMPQDALRQLLGFKLAFGVELKSLNPQPTPQVGAKPTPQAETPRPVEEPARSKRNGTPPGPPLELMRAGPPPPANGTVVMRWPQWRELEPAPGKRYLIEGAKRWWWLKAVNGTVVAKEVDGVERLYSKSVEEIARRITTLAVQKLFAPPPPPQEEPTEEDLPF